jgi:nucleotide-binding universal stress UspA family protein
VVRGRVASHATCAHEDGLAASIRFQAETLQSLGLRSELAVQATTEHVATALAAVAAEHHADLIVVRRSRRELGCDRPLGGVASQLGFAASCPVLIVD